MIGPHPRHIALSSTAAVGLATSELAAATAGQPQGSAFGLSAPTLARAGVASATSCASMVSDVNRFVIWDAPSNAYVDGCVALVIERGNLRAAASAASGTSSSRSAGWRGQ